MDIEQIQRAARQLKNTKVVHPLKLNDKALNPRRVAEGKPILAPSPQPQKPGAHLRRNSQKREKLPDALFDPLFSNESVHTTKNSSENNNLQRNSHKDKTSKIGSFIRRCSTPSENYDKERSTAEEARHQVQVEKVKGDLFDWIADTEEIERQKEAERLALFDRGPEDSFAKVMWDCKMNEKARVASRQALEQFWANLYKEDTQVMEWYAPYWRIKPFLFPYTKPRKEILVAGCGNSEVSFDIYMDGCTNVTNIDISREIIERMNGKYTQACPKMKWKTMDARTMTFMDNSMDVVVDKGLVDTLVSCNNGGVHARKYSAEVFRVLKEGGTWIIFSTEPSVSAAKCNGHVWVEKTDKLVAENDSLVYVHTMMKSRRREKVKERKFDPFRDLTWRQ